MAMTPGACARCLVVDEDPLVRWSLVRFLEAHCREARSVASGELALALLPEWPVDILITATCLSGMDGLELVSRCQGLRRRPGIILLSGGEAPPPSGGLGHLGVLAVIEKPLIHDALARLLSGNLKQSGAAA